MSDFLLPFLVAFRPWKGTALIPSMVAWWRPFATAAVLTVLVALLSHRVAVDMTLSHLPPTATPGDVVQVRDWLDAGLPARTLLLPVRFSIECALSALVLLAFSRAFTGRRAGSFRGFFILAAAASIIPLMGRCAGILLSAGLDESIRPFVQVPLSVAALLPRSGDYRVELLLTSLNLTTLWYVGSVTVGVAVLCRCKAWKAVLVAVAAWTVTTVVSITVLSLLRNAFQFGL